MYHDLPKLWFSLDDKNIFPQIVKGAIHDDVASNLGMLTNVIPLEQALIDLGYLNIFPKGAIDLDRPVAEISLDNKFLVKLESEKYTMTCPILNIYRNPTQSWLKVRVSSKLSSEI